MPDPLSAEGIRGVRGALADWRLEFGSGSRRAVMYSVWRGGPEAAMKLWCQIFGTAVLCTEMGKKLCCMR